MKYNVNDKKAKLEAQAEAISAAEMMDAFRQDLFLQFKKRKNQIEDWQDVTAKLGDLKNRLRVVADKNTWTKDNVMDMALICAIIWNNKN